MGYVLADLCVVSPVCPSYSTMVTSYFLGTPGWQEDQVEKDVQLSYSTGAMENDFPWTWLFKGKLLSLGSLGIIALSLCHPRLRGTEFEHTFL